MQSTADGAHLTYNIKEQLYKFKIRKCRITPEGDDFYNLTLDITIPHFMMGLERYLLQLNVGRPCEPDCLGWGRGVAAVPVHGVGAGPGAGLLAQGRNSNRDLRQ